MLGVFRHCIAKRSNHRFLNIGPVCCHEPANLTGHCESSARREQMVKYLAMIGCFKNLKEASWKLFLNICPTAPYLAVPPWNFKELSVDLGLLDQKQKKISLNKSVNCRITWQEKTKKIKNIYTDAFKMTDRRGVAYIISNSESASESSSDLTSIKIFI